MHRSHGRKPSTRRTVHAAVLLWALVMAGCKTYGAASPAEVTPSTAVRLEFSPPRSLLFLSQAGDSLRRGAVEQLRGRMVELSADSLTVEVSSIRMRMMRSPEHFGPGTLVRVPSQTVDVVRTDPVRSTLLAILLVGGAVAFAGLLTSAQPEPQPKDDHKGGAEKSLLG